MNGLYFLPINSQKTLYIIIINNFCKNYTVSLNPTDSTTFSSQHYKVGNSLSVKVFKLKSQQIIVTHRFSSAKHRHAPHHTTKPCSMRDSKPTYSQMPFLSHSPCVQHILLFIITFFFKKNLGVVMGRVGTSFSSIRTHSVSH